LRIESWEHCGGLWVPLSQTWGWCIRKGRGGGYGRRGQFYRSERLDRGLMNDYVWLGTAELVNQAAEQRERMEKQKDGLCWFDRGRSSYFLIGSFVGIVYHQSIYGRCISFICKTLNFFNSRQF
jgi:hypothetical protein